MPAAAVAGGVIGAGGALYGAEKQQQAYKYNAALADQAAQSAIDKAAYEETMQRERAGKFISSQKAGYAKSGVEMSGSASDVIQESISQSELDALAIRYGGELEASQLRSQAKGLREQGKTAKNLGYFQAGSSLLSGGSQAYGMMK